MPRKIIIDGFRLIPPRKGKSPYWSVRGTYKGIRVERTCGSLGRSNADDVIAGVKREIDDELKVKTSPASASELTFVDAAARYVRDRQPRTQFKRYINRLSRHFRETAAMNIDQNAVDEAAAALHPTATNGTRNACVYTPVSAILKHNNIAIKLRRPKGAKGRIVTDWLSFDDARAIILAAETIDPELALLLRFLVYTGVRLGEALKLTWDDVRLAESAAWVRRQKDGIASDVLLREDLRVALEAHGGEAPRGRVFRFHQGGHLKHQLVRAKLKALGMPVPPARHEKSWHQPPNRLRWVNFHTMRHTWATWMRRYGGADVKDLVATENWRDDRSASRYTHAVAREAWRKVELLPAIGGKLVETA